MRRKREIENSLTLVHKNKIKVRFSEVDSMKIVWHGEYIKYFEDGRSPTESLWPPDIQFRFFLTGKKNGS